MLPVERRILRWGATFLAELTDDKLPDLLLDRLLVERTLTRLLLGRCTPAACSCSATPDNEFSAANVARSCKADDACSNREYN